MARLGIIASVLLAFTALMLVAPTTDAQPTDTKGEIFRSHKGITVFGQPPLKGVRYDTPNMPTAQGVAKQIKSIDLIYKQLPKSRIAIERLKKAGDVYIGYIPGALERRLSASVRVAIYAPDFFKQQGARRRFVIIVGRHGIKWPIKQMTSVMVHEITGHGIQDLEGRLDKVRTVDAECEAWLLEIYANQRFGFDKKQRKMINFHKQLELQYCKPFKAYVGKHKPQILKAWNRLNPQVFTVLSAFPSYLTHLRKTGALKAEKALSKKLQDKALDQSMISAKPAEAYAMGKRLWSGDVGQPQNKPKAIEWFKHAAKGGHTEAQYALGHLYQTG